MRTRESGVAIVLAISVVAMAAIVAAAIMVSQSTWARQLELTAEHVQARAVLQAGADLSQALGAARGRGRRRGAAPTPSAPGR